MRYWSLPGRVMAVAGLLAGLAVTSLRAEEAQPIKEDPTPPPEYDFVQQAGAMTFDGSQLTLTDANTGVLYFSDRPYRIGGQILNQDFAGYWELDEGFKGDPPNAVISVLSETGTAPALVELTSAKSEGSTMVYEVEVLRGDLPETATGVALFIDHGPRPRRAGPPPRGDRPPHGAYPPPGRYPPHHPAGFEPYGPYCYHAPQDPRCRAWHHPHHPYYPPYPPPYHPYGPYYHPGAAYAAGVAAGAAMANAGKQPTYYYYPIPSGPLPQDCWINSQHTQMVCSVPLQ